MVGCMGESVVSVAAGLAFALANGNVRWADLDSHMNLVRDVAPALRFEAGDLVAPSTAGLGGRADAPFGGGKLHSCSGPSALPGQSIAIEFRPVLPRRSPELRRLRS